MSEPLQVVEGADGIRRFSDANIQAAIDHAIAELGPDDHVAVIAHADQAGDVTLSAVARLGAGFSVMAAAFKAHDKPLVFAAEIVWKPGW